MKKWIFAIGVSFLMSFGFCMQVFAEDTNLDPTSNGTPTDYVLTEEIKVDKTAGELDENQETTVDLNFEGTGELEPQDIVFVLDKSTYANTDNGNQLLNESRAFLENIYNQAQTRNLDVKVGVVLFTATATISQPLSDVINNYDAIYNALAESTGSGTNLHAGLLCAKEMLDADTQVKPENKHVILMTDGDTYLYCKDGDYTIPYTRSYGDPINQIDANGNPYRRGRLQYGSGNLRGTFWEVDNRDVNFNNNATFLSSGDYYLSSGNKYIVYGHVPGYVNSLEDMIEYMDFYRNQYYDSNANWAQYDYEYSILDQMNNSFADMITGYNNRTNGKFMPLSFESPTNRDVAMILADEVFQEMYNMGYDMNTFYLYNSLENDVVVRYFARYSNNGQLDTNFDKLTKRILWYPAKGSYVEDFMGEDFDFVEDINTIQLVVDSITLDKEEISKGVYGFGALGDGQYRYVLTHTNQDQEKIVLSINELLDYNKKSAITIQRKTNLCTNFYW